MKKESLSQAMPKLIMIVSLVVCVGAVLGALGYALTKPKSLVQNSSVIEKDETANLSSKALATENWKTYRNEEYGFEFKYPFNEQDGRYSVTDFGASFSSDANNPTTSINIALENSDLGERKNIIMTIDISSDNEISNSLLTKIKNVNKEKFVNGIAFSGFKISGIGDDSFGYITNHKGNYFVFESIFDSAIFNQILSTFKFIEKDETADWKTYDSTNLPKNHLVSSDFKYTFQYPSDWEVGEETEEQTVTNKNEIELAKFSVRFLVNSDWGDNIVELNKGFDYWWDLQQKNADIDHLNSSWSSFLCDKAVERWTLISKEEIKFLGRSSLKVVFKDSKNISKSTLIYTPYKDTDMVFQLELLNYQDQESVDKLLDQVFSTFKFIEK